MSSELTEEEMRRALFGTPQPEDQVSAPQVQEPEPEMVPTKPAEAPPSEEESGESIYAKAEGHVTCWKRV